MFVWNWKDFFIINKGDVVVKMVEIFLCIWCGRVFDEGVLCME